MMVKSYADCLAAAEAEAEAVAVDLSAFQGAQCHSSGKAMAVHKRLTRMATFSEE